MNTSILPLSLIAVILLSGLQADAQCRRFSKQRVLGALEADMVLDRITAGAIGRGETAATLMPIHDSGDIELLISTHPDLGRVTFRILDNNIQKRIVPPECPNNLSVSIQRQL